jgi:hypothetical protein
MLEQPKAEKMVSSRLLIVGPPPWTIRKNIQILKFTDLYRENKSQVTNGREEALIPVILRYLEVIDWGLSIALQKSFISNRT